MAGSNRVSDARRRASLLFVLLSVAMFVYLVGAQHAQAGATQVVISGNSYSPATVTISRGGEVEWRNEDNVTHSVTADGGQFNYSLPSGEKQKTLFNSNATYTYHCQIHSSMTGTLVVGTGGSTPTPTATPTSAGGTATPTPSGGATPTPAPTSISIPVGDKWFGASSYAGSTFVSNISVGSSITWTWASGVGDHNVRGTNSSFSSNVANGPFVTTAPNTGGPGTYGPLTFGTPGSYYYRCTLHPGDMKGQVNVTGSVATATPTATPIPGSTATPTPTNTPVPTATPTPTPLPAGTSLISIPVGDNWFGNSSSSGYPFVALINTGDSVQWTWASGVGDHNVRGTNSTFSSNLANGPFVTNAPIVGGPGSYGPLVFNTPGTYYYRCTFHPSEMMGIVTVTGAVPTPTPTSTPIPGATATPTPTNTPVPTATPTPTPLPAGSQDVEVRDFYFSPDVLSVNTGTTVVWTWVGAAPHVVKDQGNSFNSGILEQFSTFGYKFDSPGTYAVLCSLHNGMTMTITVTGDVPTPVPGATATPTRTATPIPTATPTPLPGTIGVEVDDNFYSPAAVTVNAGSTVRWSWVGAVMHTVTAQGGTFDSGYQSPGASFQYTFNTPGTFNVNCLLHPGMSMTVTVTGTAPTPNPNATPTATPAPTSTPAPPPPPPPGSTGVQVLDNTFAPDMLNLSTGSTVVWTWVGDTPHTVTHLGGAFDAGINLKGATFQYTFNTPGTYNIVCILHAGMAMTVKVEGAAVTPPPGATATPTRTPAPGSTTPTPVPPSTVNVKVLDNSFSPTNLTVGVGSTIVWAWEGTAPHTVTTFNGGFDSGILTNGATYQQTFNEAGTYAVYCLLHTGMAMTVSVGGQPLGTSSLPNLRPGMAYGVMVPGVER